MITAYEYLHARDDYSADGISDKANQLIEKYSAPSHIVAVADVIGSRVIEPAAKDHKPVVIVSEGDVRTALFALEPDAGDGELDAATRPATIALVDWLRRNTQFRSVAYTGTGANFTIEP